MDKKALAEKLNLDWDFAEKAAEIPDYVSLEGALEMLDPSLTEEALWYDDISDKYAVSHLSDWIVFGALVNRYGNQIPAEDIDFSYFKDFDFGFIRLGDLYDEVLLNMKNAKDIL